MLLLDQLQANHSPTRDKKSRRTPVIATDNKRAACAGRWVVGISKILGGHSKEDHSASQFLEEVSAKQDTFMLAIDCFRPGCWDPLVLGPSNPLEAP